MKLNLSIICILLLSACGKSSTPNNTIQKYPSQDGKQLFDAAQVYCADVDCPAPVALLTVYENAGAGMCTSFLITPNLALTNSHCVPDEVKANPYLAKSRMKLMFPSTGNFAERSVGIQQVLKVSDISGATGQKPDYALLRLSENVEDRKPLVISDAGIPDEADLTAWVVTPQSKSAVIGALEKKNCSSMMKSAVYPSYNDPYSSVFSFSNCEVKHGNSGSPVLDSEGKVRGLVHATIEAKNLRGLQNSLQLSSIDFLNLGTNIACIDLPGYHKITNQRCFVSASTGGDLGERPDAETEKELYAQAEEELKQKVETWSGGKTGRSNFQWTLSTDNNGRSLSAIPVPKCFLSTPPGSLSSSTTSVSTPSWSVTVGFDPKLRRKAIIKSTGNIYMDLLYSTADLKMQNKTTVRYSAYGAEYTRIGYQYLYNVSYCE